MHSSECVAVVVFAWSGITGTAWPVGSPLRDPAFALTAGCWTVVSTVSDEGTFRRYGQRHSTEPRCIARRP